MSDSIRNIRLGEDITGAILVQGHIELLSIDGCEHTITGAAGNSRFDYIECETYEHNNKTIKRFAEKLQQYCVNLP